MLTEYEMKRTLLKETQFVDMWASEIATSIANEAQGSIVWLTFDLKCSASMTGLTIYQALHEVANYVDCDVLIRVNIAFLYLQEAVSDEQ